MCNCNLPTGAVCVRSSCRECIRRALDGPNYDPKRGTGRTTVDVMSAVLAAACGQRVLLVAVNGNSATYMVSMALKMLVDAKVADSAVESHTAERITFANGGWLDVRSMSANIEFRGCREPHCPTLHIWDHAALEKKEEEARAQQRLADGNEIKRLMRKNGWICAEDTCANGRDKLVFRT